MHIGGFKEFFKIGGVDSPVIKDKYNYPYIPGSTLKGKIRSLLEQKYKLNHIAQWNSNDINEKRIAFVFGPSDSKERETPIVVVFRDAPLSEEFKGDPEKLYEIKGENTIDRETSRANPRFIERVVPGVSFDFEIEIHEYLFDENGKYRKKDFEISLDEVKELIKEGLNLLENDYLGGSGTRGYGKVKIKFE